MFIEFLKRVRLWKGSIFMLHYKESRIIYSWEVTIHIYQITVEHGRADEKRFQNRAYSVKEVAKINNHITSH